MKWHGFRRIQRMLSSWFKTQSPPDPSPHLMAQLHRQEDARHSGANTVLAHEFEASETAIELLQLRRKLLNDTDDDHARRSGNS